MHLEPKPKSQCNDSALEVPDASHLVESFLGDTNEDNLPGWKILVSHKLLFKEQHEDTTPRQKCSPNKNDNCEIESFSANSSAMCKLITCQGKMCAPKML